MVKIIDNYSNFDIRQLKNGEFSARPDRDLREYTVSFSIGPYKSIELAKEAIDRYWRGVH